MGGASSSVEQTGGVVRSWVGDVGGAPGYFPVISSASVRPTVTNTHTSTSAPAQTRGQSKAAAAAAAAASMNYPWSDGGSTHRRMQRTRRRAEGKRRRRRRVVEEQEEEEREAEGREIPLPDWPRAANSRRR